MQKHNERYGHLIVSLSRMQRRAYRVSRSYSTHCFIRTYPFFLESCSLDESEVYPGTRTSNHPVVFYGIIEIKSLSWLSPRGRKWLEADVQKRDIEKHIHKHAHPVSELTLAFLYGEADEGGLPSGGIFGERRSKLRLRVWIRGVKNMSVAFHTCTSSNLSV
jgi:hypothetical protein